MKRISLVLLPGLLLAALVPLGSLSAAARSGVDQVQATATGRDGLDCDHDGGGNPIDDICTPTGTLPATAIDTPTGTLPATQTALTGTITPIATGSLTITPTATGSLTVTPTTGACPGVEQANFGAVAAGGSVEGLGAVAPDVNISSPGNSAVHVAPDVQPAAYYANGPQGHNSALNGGVDALNNGFSDFLAHKNRTAAHFTFTFSPGLTVSDFTVHMLDYGDWNPTHSAQHLVILRAFDASNTLVTSQRLVYKTSTGGTPNSSDRYGDLQVNGDALKAPAGMPGNWTWHLTGTGITRIVFDVGAGPDPNFALDAMSVTFACP